MNSSELLEALGARPDGEARWRARTPEHLQGAYGGTFGGLLAALAVGSAAGVEPGRVPFSLDAQFLRGLRGEEAEIRCEIVRSGRSLTAVAVSILDGDSLATRATVMLADVGVLDDWDLVPDHPAPPAGGGMRLAGHGTAVGRGLRLAGQGHCGHGMRVAGQGLRLAGSGLYVPAGRHGLPRHAADR